MTHARVKTDDRAVAAPTTVLIVDDHHAFADLLALALGYESDFSIVGSAATAAAGLELAVRTRPAMVIMDIHLGAQDGLEATRRIREVVPETIVVVVSAHCDASLVARAASAGASAFAPKSGSLSELLWVLRRARSGSMLVAPSLFRQGGLAALTTSGSAVALTSREREVLTLMGRGIPPVQIARVLNISVHTCRGYVKSIHSKLGVRSQLEAVVKAQQLGLIDSGP